MTEIKKSEANHKREGEEVAKKRSTRKDIGMLMFLLAAETAVVTGQLSVDSTAVARATAATTLSPEVRFSSPASSADSASSSAGETHSDSGDDSMTPIENRSEVFLPGSRAHSRAAWTAATPILAAALQYLSWTDLIKVRGVSRSWLAASEAIVRLRPLEGSACLAAFFPCPKDFDRHDAEEEQRLQFVHPGYWRCSSCGFFNGTTRILCANRVCQRPSLTHASCTRLFVGQLRRDSTISFVRWMLARIVEAPSDALRNAENHRNKETNRGKGCAWVYFERMEDAAALMACHRRAFLDVDGEDEGVWLVRSGSEELLQQYTTKRGYAEKRSKTLPRNAVVIEAPVTGAKPSGPGADASLAGCPPTAQQIAEQYIGVPDEPFMMLNAAAMTPRGPPGRVGPKPSHLPHFSSASSQDPMDHDQHSTLPPSSLATPTPTATTGASTPVPEGSTTTSTPSTVHNPYDPLVFGEEEPLVSFTDSFGSFVAAGPYQTRLHNNYSSPFGCYWPGGSPYGYDYSRSAYYGYGADRRRYAF